MTSVSVRKLPPGRRSEPISKKLTVSCPLLSTWLPEGSIVESGATVLMSMFGSMVGSGDAVSTGVPVAGSTVAEGRIVPVGVQGIG